jgi:hypothetical protein
MYVINTETSDHFIAELHHDTDCGNPFTEYDQVGILAPNPHTHKWLDTSDDADWYDTERAYYRLGIKLLDYGSTGYGLRTNRITPGFQSQEDDWLGEAWKRSTLERYDAIIYTTRQRAEQMHSGPRTTPAQIWEALEQEAETWRQWMSGECYGVIIHSLDADGESLDDHVDSCWGFLGYDDPMEPARDMLKDCEHTYATEQAQLATTGGWVSI